MKTSNEINELAAALSKAQAQFTPVLKKAKGVHNSSYAEYPLCNFHLMRTAMSASLIA